MDDWDVSLLSHLTILKLTDGKQSPRDGGRTSSITLARSKGVRAAGGREEEEAEEDKDLGPNPGVVGVGVDAEGLERGENNEDDGPYHVSWLLAKVITRTASLQPWKREKGRWTKNSSPRPSRVEWFFLTT